jgi:Zn finger protein HypA/HybF involved in hydrogenase expression
MVPDDEGDWVLFSDHETEVADVMERLRMVSDLVIQSSKRAAKAEAIIAVHLHHRRCWDCGAEGYHTSTITPAVLCHRCGSQDTRAIKRQKIGGQDGEGN